MFGRVWNVFGARVIHCQCVPCMSPTRIDMDVSRIRYVSIHCAMSSVHDRNEIIAANRFQQIADRIRVINESAGKTRTLPPSTLNLASPPTTKKSPLTLTCTLSGTSHDERIWSISWHPNGHQFASCGADKTVRIWQRFDDLATACPASSRDSKTTEAKVLLPKLSASRSSRRSAVYLLPHYRAKLHIFFLFGTRFS